MHHRIERELLDDLGKVARVELDLPPIPIDEIDIRSNAADLVVGIRTPLPSRGAIAATARSCSTQPQPAVPPRTVPSSPSAPHRTPQVSAERGHLVLATNDAKVEDVEGSAAIKAGLFFGGVSRRSFEHVESIAAQTDFELGQQSLRAQLHNATRDGDDFVLGLTLSPTPTPAGSHML